MKLSAAIAAGLLALMSAAAAQTPDVAVMGSEAAQGEPAQGAEKQDTQILVLGDALGGGLAAGLSRVAEAQGSGEFEVSIRFNEESGLARPEVYDWPATVPKILESNSYDVIVVMLGANDRQVIRTGSMRYPFNTEGWVTAYKAQLDIFLDTLSASRARIIWVGPPPMKDPEYDAAVLAIAAIQRERVEQRGFTFIDMRPELSAPGGGYAENGKDDTGEVRKLRGRDGISFFKAGNNRMAQIVLAAIESGAGPTSDAAAQSGTGKTDKESAQSRETLRQVPVFGQSLMNGEAYVVQPEGVTANAVMLAGAGLNAEAALRTLREISPKGSSAQKLFLLGEPAAAPAGRPDDFTLPPEPSTQ